MTDTVLIKIYKDIRRYEQTVISSR